jgi:hypothetical protein
MNTSIAVPTDDGWLLAASQNTTHRRFAEKLMGKLVSRQPQKMRFAKICRPAGPTGRCSLGGGAAPVGRPLQIMDPGLPPSRFI